MQVGNDEGTHQAQAEEPVAREGMRLPVMEDSQADPPAENEDWLLEEAGYGHGV